MISALPGTLGLYNFLVKTGYASSFIFFLLPDGPKLHNKKPSQSGKNQRSLQASVRELSFRLQRHQSRNEPRECVQTRIIPTFSTTRVQSQPHHLARAASGHSMAWVVLSRSSRGSGSGGIILCVLCIVYNLFSVLYSLCFALLCIETSS